MRNRAKQRENRRRGREEKLELRDYCGVKDPTPYEAVEYMIAMQRGHAARKVVADGI